MGSLNDRCLFNQVATRRLLQTFQSKVCARAYKEDSDRSCSVSLESVAGFAMPLVADVLRQEP